MFHRREPRDRQEEVMDVLYPVCAGIDVHRDTLVVTVSRAVERRARSETRTFGAVTEEVRALVAWLDEQRFPSWPWRARACTGSPSTARSARSAPRARCGSSTRLTSRRCRAARPTSRTARGSPSYHVLKNRTP